ncbi:MAG: tRNA lysidine(34) synthetase TilS [Alphaproteobacteria bacterium]|nr:tRNA lysidine(34) synthetase TilS [Alphaproteobacteria bacterium]
MGADAAPLSPRDFDRLMMAVGPFADPPRIALAVSGGADSLALCLLTARWTHHRGGQVWALTVDHGLRPESAAEIRTVARWLRARGIAHRVLRWRGAKPAGGIQANARAARYRLLTEWCSRHDVLHLMLAHQAEDQSETVLLRLRHGSGPDGLAGIAAVTERSGVRILRPLLDVPRARLKATLGHLGQRWLEDPSNENVRFERIRMRRWLATDGREIAAESFVDARIELGRLRAQSDAKIAAHLAVTTTLDEAGFAIVDRDRFCRTRGDIGVHALQRLAICLGSGEYAPRREPIERLWLELQTGAVGAGRTLGGCRFVPYRDGLLVCREAGRIGPSRPFDGRLTVWDERFTVALPQARRRLKAGFSIAALGDYEKDLRRDRLEPLNRFPRPVRATLPAVWAGGHLAAVPHAGYVDPSFRRVMGGIRVVWTPRQPLAAATFAIVTSPLHII